MAAEPQVVRIVLEDPAGGRQPAPGQRPSWMPPPNPVPPGSTNRLPPPNPNAGSQPGPGPGPQSGPAPPPPNPQPPPPNPVLADMAARADKVAESNKTLAAAMASPAYLSATLRLAAAEEQRAELAKMEQQLADKARETLKYGPGGKPAGTDTTAGVGDQADAVAKASAELAGAIANPAYQANLERLAAAQERHTELTKEQQQLAERARDVAKYGPGGKPAGTDTLAGMGDQADKQAKANKELAAAMKDPAYAAGQKRLLDVEKERVELAKRAAKIADEAKYGAKGAAGKAAAEGVADRGGGAIAQLAAGAVGGGKEGAAAAAEGLGGMASAAQLVAGEMADTAARLGNVGQQIVNNDVGGLLAGTANTVADGLMLIPGPAGAVGAGLKVATAAATAYAEVTEALVQRGRELMGYNADLAAANAMANVKRMEADMKEAEAIGKGTGRLTENQADISANLRELILPIKELLVEIMADASEGFKTFTELAKPLGVVLKWMIKVSFALPLGVLKLIGKVAEQLNRWLPGGGDDEPKEGELNSLMKSLFDSFDRIQPGQGMPGAGRAAPAPRPMFGRGL